MAQRLAMLALDEETSGSIPGKTNFMTLVLIEREDPYFETS